MDPQRTLDAMDPSYESEAPSLGSLLKPNLLSEWSWTLGYTAILSTVTVLRYHVWLATGWDMGFNLQALWLLAHRGVLAVSPYIGHPVLADAASYILVLLAPLYSVGGVGFLLVLQAFALGLGYVFARRIAERLGVAPQWAHLVGALYLIYPTVLGANLYDFHPDVLAVPLLFAVIWTALEEKWIWYAVLLLFALLVKDTMPIVVVGLGITMLLRRNWTVGVLTLLAAVGTLGLDVLVVIPRLLHGTMTQWLTDYGGLGATPSDFVLHVVRDPLVLVAWARQVRSWEYLAWILGPVAVLVALGRGRALSAFWVPVLFMLETNLLANSGITTDPFNQYTLFAVPFLFAVVLEGIAGAELANPAWRRAAGVLPLIFLLMFVWHVHGPDWSDQPANSRALTAAADMIPRDARVVAPNVLAAYFADRAWEGLPANVIGTTLPKGTYVIFNATDPLALVDPDPAGSDGAVLRAVSRAGYAKIIYRRDHVIVYKVNRPVAITPRGAR